MKKNLLPFSIILFFLLEVLEANAQKDLIITQAGEEIRCKILDETPTKFKYAYLGTQNKILRNEIFKNLVQSFKYGYYSSDILKNDKVIEKTKSRPSSRAIPLASVDKNNALSNDPKIEKKTILDRPENLSKQEKTNILKSEETNQENDKIIEEKFIEKEKSIISANNKKTDNENSNSEKPDLDSKKVDEKKIEPKKSEIVKKESKKEEVSPLADQVPNSEFKNYLKYRVGLKGGLGNIISSNKDNSPYGLYKEKLLRGWIFGIDAAYFFNDNLGIGATYTNFQTKNSNNNLDYPNLFTKEIIKGGQLSNKESHKFIGPTFLFRKNIDYKTFVIVTLSPGMHFYSDKGLTNLAKYSFTGRSFGSAATLGLDFLIGNDIFGRDIILSLEGGYNYGNIPEINNGIENINLAKPVNLNRLDFTIGLRFTRFPMYLR
jgi:hypothetical protein